MNNIEQEVRIALANDFGNRARDIFSDAGRNAAIRKQIVDSVSGVLEGLVSSGDMSRFDAFEFGNDIIPKFVDSYNAEGMSKQTADLWMDDEAAAEEKIGIYFEMAEARGMEFPKELHSLYGVFLSLTQRRGNVVADLVGKAENEGIQNVTNQDDLHAAVRREYTTAHDYVSATAELMDSCVNLISGVTLQHCEGDDIVGKLFPEIAKRITQLYMDTIVKADVEVLYGV